MKIPVLFLALVFLVCQRANTQDTLAIQDFETSPATPTWSFTGPVVYNQGFSSSSAAPPNSPIGIGGSRAWESTQISGGLTLEFANVNIPSNYDSVTFQFRLAAMNLNSSSGGPDNLDFVLVEISTNGGATYYNRLRIRGATSNNSFWAYSATAVADISYLPQTEVVFQPTSSGLQTTNGYSTVKINFPNTVSQVRIRMTGRSSSSSDTWLVDNVMLLGFTNCPATDSTIVAEICQGQTYFAQGANQTTSGTYRDTLMNSAGCDSIVITQLTVHAPAIAPTQVVDICEGDSFFVQGAYQTVSGMYYDSTTSAVNCDSVMPTQLTVHPPAFGPVQMVEICEGESHFVQGAPQTTSGTYYDSLQTTGIGCDSIVETQLTVIPRVFGPTFNDVICEGDSSMIGGVYQTTAGTYYDTLMSAANCDSIVTIVLDVFAFDLGVTVSGGTLTSQENSAMYQWVDCDAGYATIPGAFGQSFTPTTTGRYAVVLVNDICREDTSDCYEITPVGIQNVSAQEAWRVYPIPAREQVAVDFGALYDQVSLNLIDASGRSVRQYRLQGVSGHTVPVQGLPAGWYLLQLEADGQRQVVRLPVVE